MKSPKVEVGNVQLIQRDPLLGLPGVKYGVSVKGVKPKLVEGHIEILFPKDTATEQIKAKLNMIIEFTNQWVFSRLPGVYFSLPDPLLQALKDKPLGYKVWATIYYKPGKGIKPLGLTVHLINTNTKNLIWLYMVEDYGVKHSRTNVRVELSKSFGRHFGKITGEGYIQLLKLVIDGTKSLHKSFNVILEKQALNNSETYSKMGVPMHVWIPHVERKVYKQGGFTQFLKMFVYNTYASMVNYYLRTDEHLLKAKDNVAIGFLPNGDLVINGAEGIIRNIGCIMHGSLRPYLDVMYPVTGYNWVELFIANSQKNY